MGGVMTLADEYRKVIEILDRDKEIMDDIFGG